MNSKESRPIQPNGLPTPSKLNVFNHAEDPMNRDEVLNTLRAHKPTPCGTVRRHRVILVRLLCAGTRLPTRSDVDILVRFSTLPQTGEATLELNSTWRTCWADQWIWRPTRSCGPKYVPMWSETRWMYEEARNWRLYIRDMLEFGQKVVFYTEELD